MKAPPLLPEVILERVMRVGRIHGGCVLYVAGFLALLTAATGDITGTAIGLLVAGAGAIEHHGSALLGQRESRGITWLWFSQVVLFAGIAVYCGIRLTHEVIPPIPTEEMRRTIEMQAEQLGMTTDQYLRFFYRFLFRAVLIASFFYQGGMGLYYLRKRDAVHKALD